MSTSAMTDWPREDAPLSEWLRPVSATLRNQREPETAAPEGRHGRLAHVVVNMRKQAKRRHRKGGA